MHQTTRDRLRFGTFALLSVLVAAPGNHLFELWLDHSVAIWLSHSLALLGLAATAWYWRRAARAGGTRLGRSAV